MEVGFIKEVFREIPHVVATRDANGIRIKGLTEYGKTLASELDLTRSALQDSIPAGFVFTGFLSQKNISNEVKSLLSNGDSAPAVVHDSIKIRTSVKTQRMVSIYKKSNKLNASFRPLSTMNGIANKTNAVSFKANAFLVNKKRSALAQKIKAGQIGINPHLGTIREIPSNQFSSQYVEESIGRYGNSFVRKAVSTKSNSLERGPSRRANRRAKSLSSAETRHNRNIHPHLRFSIAVIDR